MHRLQGLRYALPPVGVLRWHAPVLYSHSIAECPAQLDARVFGNQCAQLGGVGGASGSGVVLGSEDCLFLNVWTPSLTAESNDLDSPTAAGAGGAGGAGRVGGLLDVMVRIHDGGLVTGSGHEPGKSIGYQ